MTLEEYIKLPKDKMTPYNPANAQRLYAEYLSSMMRLTETPQFTIDKKFYKNMDKSKLWLVLGIPSESLNESKFKYDVLLKFDKITGSGADLLNGYTLTVFSNDPSFAFNNARAYKLNKLLAKPLENKLSFLQTNTTGLVRNPNEDLYINKLVYYGYLILHREGLLSVSNFSKRATTALIENEIYSHIKSYDQKNDEKLKYKNIKPKPVTPDKIAKDLAKTTKLIANTVNPIRSVSSTIKRVKTIGSIKRK
jgi:hypothetical protein